MVKIIITCLQEIAAVGADGTSLNLWTSGPLLRYFLNPKVYWFLGNVAIYLPVLPCWTDSPSCPSRVCWLENAAGSWSGWWVPPQAWCLKEHQAKATNGEGSLEQQLQPVHTPPLECRTELLLSGHVATNLRVTGFIFSSGASAPSSHCYGNTNDCWTEGAGRFNLNPNPHDCITDCFCCLCC